jgi:putative addiction module killer protein
VTVELRYYQTAGQRLPFAQWLRQLRDIHARARVRARLARVAAGNFGDVRQVGEGVMELRIDYGPGYRAYFARMGNQVVLLLCGGDKSTQEKDIARAKGYLEDYKRRTAQRRGA